MSDNDVQSVEKKKTLKDYKNEEIVEMPASFARELIRQVVYNPQKTSSQKSYSYSVYTKENILSWLQSPSSNEKNLRNASNYMYLSSMHYQRLLNYYSGLPTGAYVISPVGFETAEEIKFDNFKKQYFKVAQFLELVDVPALVKEIIVVALRDGAYYGVRWSDKTSSFIQKIDADYCKITSISNGSFLYSVDMSKLSDKLEFYPDAFTKMYSDYISTGQKWQEVPSDISVCVKGDNSIVDYTVPPFAAVMPSLYYVASVEALQETADELRNYKMITGKVDTDENGNPVMEWDLFLKYYNHLKNAIGDQVGLAVTPFKLESFTFEQKSGISDVDEISKATNNFWSTAGSSGLLHGLSNNTSGVTKLAIKNDETYVLGMLKQIERVLNRYLKVNFSNSYKFKITILPISIYNKEDYLKYYKEAVSFGLGKSYYAAALGIPQFDIAGLDYMEQNLLSMNNLSPMKNTYNSTESEENGRPASDDEDLSDSGQKTRDNDTNSNK